MALAPPDRDQPRDHRDQEDLPRQRLEHRQRLRQPDCRRDVAEAERRQRDEAEVDELRLAAAASGCTKNGPSHLVDGQVHEREQQTEQEVDADRSEDGLVGDRAFMCRMRLSVIGSVAVTSSADRQQVGQPDQVCGVRRTAPRARAPRRRRSRSRCAALTRCPVVGSLIATTSATAASSVLPHGAPAQVVDELEQQEVRDQQHEQAGVAVDEADEVVPRRLAHASAAGALHRAHTRTQTGGHRLGFRAMHPRLAEARRELPRAIRIAVAAGLAWWIARLLGADRPGLRGARAAGGDPRRAVRGALALARAHARRDRRRAARHRRRRAVRGLDLRRSCSCSSSGSLIGLVLRTGPELNTQIAISALLLVVATSDADTLRARAHLGDGARLGHDARRGGVRAAARIRCARRSAG